MNCMPTVSNKDAKNLSFNHSCMSISLESNDDSSLTPVNDSDIICNICADLILDYSPVFFMGEEVNPACKKCRAIDESYDVYTSQDTDCNLSHDESVPQNIPLTAKGFKTRSDHAIQVPVSGSCSHEKVCKLREPFPPPLPSVTPLQNNSSNYHLRMKEGLLDWGFTCGYCFRIDHKNYGCASCVWLKWFGDLHGYPDMNPHDYRKYLE